MKIVTIIPCLGKAMETRRCLRSMMDEGTPENSVLVVENGTTENKSVLSSEFPQVHFLALPENLGFAGGVNRGIEEAKKLWNPDFYFLLNNDATVEKGTLGMLRELLQEDDKYGLAAPKIFLYPSNGILWSAGGSFNSRRFLGENRGQGEKDDVLFQEVEECSFLSACVLMIRREVIETVGLLDERFFTYSEDLDFCLRAAKAEWKLVYQPRAVVVHEGSLTAGGEYEPFQSFFRWRNRVLLIWKHAPVRQKLFLYFLFFPALMARDTFRYLRPERFKSIPFLWSGLFQALSILIWKGAGNPAVNVPPVHAKRSRLHSGYLIDNPLALFLLRIVDWIGVLFFRRILKRNEALAGPPRKILLAKIDHLGDVLMSLQVLPALKKAFPRCRMDFVCASWSEPLLRNNPWIDRVHIFDHFQLNRSGSLTARLRKSIQDCIRVVKSIRGESYDLAIDLRGYFPNFIPVLALGSVRSKIGYPTGGFGFLLDESGKWREGVHETEHYFDLLRMAAPSINREPADLGYLMDEHGTEDLLKGLKMTEPKPLLLIHAFCQRSNLREQKQWQMEEWKNVIRSLEAGGVRLICTGDEEDKEMIEKIIVGSSACNCAGVTPLPLLTGLIRRAACVLCIDTFTSHLSAALGAKTFVIFNGVEPVEQWKPWGDDVHVFPIEVGAEEVLSELHKSLGVFHKPVN